MIKSFKRLVMKATFEDVCLANNYIFNCTANKKYKYQISPLRVIITFN